MKELRKKETKDLAKLLSEKREEVRSLHFGVAGSATRNVKASRSVRREIAQILTELNARKRAIITS